MAKKKHVGLDKSVISANTIDKSIFQSFGNLIHDNVDIRLKSSATLLQVLTKNEANFKNVYQLKYALKRLIRGVGSSTTISRAGFFSTLVGLLKTIDNVEISEVIQIIQKELHVGKGDQEKIDSHANTGRILVCGALIRSGKILTGTEDEIETCLSILIKSSKVKNFHSSLSYSFLTDLQKLLNTKQFKKIMWPLMKEELTKPWSKQNLNSIYFLISAEQSHPEFMSKLIQLTIGTKEFFCKESYSSLADMFLNGDLISNINHPIYDIFFKDISNSPKLFQFWTTEIDNRLTVVNKLKETFLLKILRIIFMNSNQSINNMANLLTNNVIKVIVSRYKNNKSKDDSNYKDFFNAVLEYLQRARETCKSNENNGTLEFIKKFVINPGYLMFDRLTSSNIIYKISLLLNKIEIMEFVNLLKDIIVDVIEKSIEEKTWLNSEKMYALQIINRLLNDPKTSSEIDWKIEQLIFIMNLTLFKTKNGIKFTKENDVVESLQIVNLKHIFYHSLEIKLPNLSAERDMLLKLFKHCDEMLKNKKMQKYFKVVLSEDGVAAWDNVSKEVVRSSKIHENELELVFHILLLHMGLELFNDEKLGIGAIEELKACVHRVQHKSKSTSKDEPEWIEVVVDLFLHLLSQNSSILRNIIIKIFPHLCSSLTISSIHQILSVLDMRDGSNPLSGINELDEEDDETEENGKLQNGDDNMSEDDNNSEEGENNEDDDDFDDDSVMSDEGTVSDQLRLAISTALGSAAPETDQESLDLDEMDDEDAHRLDIALAQAFKMYSENRKRKKKSKKDKVIETTVTHFRIRVLDLLDIYLKQKEPSVSFLLEIMMGLFSMLNFCAKDGGPLLIKVQGILNRLTTLKKINMNLVSVTDLNKVFTDLSRMKFVPAAIAERNIYLSRCTIFLIYCSEMVAESPADNKFLLKETLKELVVEFIEHRNPILPVNIFLSMFRQTTYDGIWDISIILAKYIKEKIQSIRRTQIFTLLAKLYTNHRLINKNVETSNCNITKIENEIQRFISNDDVPLSQKSFGELLTLIIEINKFHKKYIKFNCGFNWDTLTVQIQEIRKRLILESTLNIYKRFCNIMNLQILNNVNENCKQANEEKDITLLTDESADDSTENNLANLKKSKQKRPIKSDTFTKMKKFKIEARAKASSVGLSNNINFTKLNKEKTNIKKNNK